MLSLGIGSQVNGIASVKSAFSSARMAAQMAYQTDKKIIDFQQMGFFKILFAADDTTILKSYEQQLLGPLESMTGITIPSIWKHCVLILKMTVV